MGTQMMTPGLAAASQILPAFADQENRSIDAAIQALEASIRATISQMEEQTKRGTAMLEHLHHVELDLAGSQARLDARRKEVASENHLTQLTTRESVSAVPPPPKKTYKRICPRLRIF